MLRYDYLIERDEGDEIRKYKPSLIPCELKDVVYIKGPNDSGKSTLLNMIALGFFGLKLRDNELDRALREKLNNLYNSNHQKIKFAIEIDNEASSTILKSTKSTIDGKEFEVQEIVDGQAKTISPEKFRQKYKLIYDIPSNPLERLPQLLSEIENAQQTRGIQVQRLRSHIVDTINKVKDSKDPEKIEALTNDLETQKDYYKEICEEIDGKKEFYNDLLKLHVTKSYLNYYHEIKMLKIKIEGLEGLEKLTAKIDKMEKKQTKDEVNYLRDYKQYSSDAQDNYNQATNILKIILHKKEKNHLELWCELNCYDEINNANEYTLREESDYFIECLSNLLEGEESEKNNEIRLLESLIEVLSEFEGSLIEMPGTNKSVTAFINLLRKSLESYQTIITRNNNIKDCIKYIEKIKSCIEKAIDNHEKYKGLSVRGKKVKIDHDMPKVEELNKLIRDKNKVETGMKQVVMKLHQLNIIESSAETIYATLKNKNEFKAFVNNYTLDQLRDKLNVIKADNDRLKEDKSKSERTINFMKDEIDRISKKKPHKYQKYLPQLNEKLRIVQNLEKKLLSDFSEQMRSIRGHDGSGVSKLSDKAKAYAEQISYFLGNKVRFVKYIDLDYEIAKIDVINKLIVSKNDKTIKFADLGTGHGQAAYLQGLLGMNDGRKIIALFDEVAMMDSLALKPILDILKKLYKENKLLLGIIVQKDDCVKIQNIV